MYVASTAVWPAEPATREESAAKKSKTCANLDANLVSSHKFVDYLYKMKTEEAQTMLSFIKSDRLVQPGWLPM